MSVQQVLHVFLYLTLNNIINFKQRSLSILVSTKTLQKTG